MGTNLRFLTRQGCHLCEDAVALLAGVSFDIIDIDHDPELLLLYDERVPVLLDATTGQVLLEGRITADQVRRLMSP
jgi:coenzyme F420-reducing hydrogenase beta subunit